MKLGLSHRILSAEVVSAADARAVLDTARALRRAHQAGVPQPLLRGKHIALLCSDAQCAPAASFEKAAAELGAHVSRLQPEEALLRGDPDGALETARLLGRLYDAVDCDHLPKPVAVRLQREVGVPVYDGLGRDEHPISRLLAELRSDAQSSSAEEDRRCLVQSLLVNTII